MITVRPRDPSTMKAIPRLANNEKSFLFNKFSFKNIRHVAIPFRDPDPRQGGYTWTKKLNICENVYFKCVQTPNPTGLILYDLFSIVNVIGQEWEYFRMLFLEGNSTLGVWYATPGPEVCQAARSCGKHYRSGSASLLPHIGLISEKNVMKEWRPRPLLILTWKTSGIGERCDRVHGAHSMDHKSQAPHKSARP